MQWSWFNTRWRKMIHTKALWLWLCRKKQSRNRQRNRSTWYRWLFVISIKDSINSDDTSTKSISADNGAIDADHGAVVNTGHATEHVAKEASDNFNAIQNTNASLNLVWWHPFLFSWNNKLFYVHLQNAKYFKPHPRVNFKTGKWHFRLLPEISVKKINGDT